MTEPLNNADCKILMQVVEDYFVTLTEVPVEKMAGETLRQYHEFREGCLYLLYLKFGMRLEGRVADMIRFLTVDGPNQVYTYIHWTYTMVRFINADRITFIAAANKLEV